MSEQSVRNQAELRKRRKEAGLCINCGRPARPNRTTCAECGEYFNRYAKKSYRNRLLAQGKTLKEHGGQPRYEYTVWRGRVIIIQGTAKEVAKYLGMTTNEVGNYARCGLRRHAGLEDAVLIERRRIDE